MYSDPKRQFSLLQKIGFVRICGTEEELKAANIIMDEIRSIGLEPELQAFQNTRCAPVEAKLTITEPVTQEFPVRGFFYGDPVDVEEEEFDFYYMEDTSPVSLANAKGKFVLLNQRPMNEEQYAKLYNAGIKGFLAMNGTIIDHREETDLQTGRLRPYYRKTGIIPALMIRMIDALEMLKLHPTKVKITAKSVEKTITSHNVVVTVPGTELLDEYVAIGAHYDSVEFSSGVWDNGAGVVIIMELLRYFKEHPPKRTLKFIFFGAEEIGLKGAQAYLRDHPEDVKKFVFMFNADVGGNIIGSNTVMTTAVDDLDGYVKTMAAEQGFPCTVIQDVMSSDSAMFNDFGIPSLAFGRYAPRGAGYMHTRYDMLSLLAPEALTPMTEFLLTISERMINSQIFPIEKTIPQKHQDLIVKRYECEGSETARKRQQEK